MRAAAEAAALAAEARRLDAMTEVDREKEGAEAAERVRNREWLARRAVEEEAEAEKEAIAARDRAARIAEYQRNKAAQSQKGWLSGFRRGGTKRRNYKRRNTKRRNTKRRSTKRRR